MKPPSKKVVYILGPYRADTINGVLHNIANAYVWMEWCWRNGYIPVCPHMNSALTDGLIPDEELLDGCTEIMSRCDAVLLTGDWENSDGSVTELGVAEELDLEVIDPYEVILKSVNPLNKHQYKSDSITTIDKRMIAPRSTLGS